MGRADHGQVALALIGHSIAHGIQNHTLVVGIYRAFQQVNGFHHMGVSADDYIHAQIAQLLGNGPLGAVFLQQVLHAPVQVHNGGLGSVLLHLGQPLLQLGIERFQIIFHKIIHDACLTQCRVSVQRGPSVRGDAGGIGVGNHADLNAVHVHNLKLFLFIIHLGTQGLQSHPPGLLQGAQDAVSGGVTAVVVGCQEHVISCVQSRLGQGIRAVEMGISLDGVIRAAERSFQIHCGIVIAGNGILHILEDGRKVVASIALLAGVDHRQVHQQVAHGSDSRRCHHVFRLRFGFRDGRFRLRRLGDGAGRQLDHTFLLGSGIRRAVGHVDTKPDDKGSRRNHQQNQNGQQCGSGSAAALGVSGHGIPPFSFSQVSSR